MTYFSQDKWHLLTQRKEQRPNDMTGARLVDAQLGLIPSDTGCLTFKFVYFKFSTSAMFSVTKWPLFACAFLLSFFAFIWVKISQGAMFYGWHRVRPANLGWRDALL